MEREELTSIQDILVTPHIFVSACHNPKCSKHTEEVEVHSDDHHAEHFSQKTRIYAPSTQGIKDRVMYCALFNECVECGCQRKEIVCYKAEAKDSEYWEQRKYDSTGPSVVTPTSKSSASYYKRWNTKEGGSPDFNPVSNTGGNGTREQAMEAVNGTKGDKMELDMTAAKRKVKNLGK